VHQTTRAGHHACRALALRATLSPDNSESVPGTCQEVPGIRRHAPGILTCHMVALVFSTPMLFAGIAFAQCGAPDASDCCAPSTSPGCAEATCCEFVCSFDISCCDVAWDASCAQTAIQFCQTCSGQGGGGCGKTSPNDCCTASVTPGCSDATCCEAVCAVDPFCCIDAWSQSCAAQALQLCTTCNDICGEPNGNDCCTPSQTPGCSDAACCETVCAIDPTCCIFGWDADCASSASLLCKPCGGGGSVCGDPMAGDCCTLSQFAGCSDAVCCETVCAVDPSCCDLFWDMDCVNSAKTMCESCGAPPCAGDVTGDGTVDGSDLAAVLVAWGSNGQGQVDTDLNDDGIVDGSDLTFILVGWGACE
jgi:hypothetical protein